MTWNDTDIDKLRTEARTTKYIDARISLTWLIGAVIAIVSSYAVLQSRVSQLTDNIAELKQDRAVWVQQSDRLMSELRSILANDAVQNTRIQNLEEAWRTMAAHQRQPMRATP